MSEIVTGLGKFGMSRREFLRKGAVVGIGGVGVAVEARTGFLRSLAHEVNKFLNRPTRDQIDAAVKLDDPKIPKYFFIVKDDPDVRTNEGLNVRKDPWIPLDPKSEPSNQTGKLKAGQRIVGMPWQGINTSSSTRRRDLSWVAFTDNNGNVGFVDRKYIEGWTPPQGEKASK